MIFGSIHNMGDLLPALPAPLRTAVQHLAETDFGKLPVGNYELQGRDIYVQVFDMTTKPYAETRPEVHRQYIDVQFMFDGEEKIGVVVDNGHHQVAEDLLAERDLLFYADAENESVLHMRNGNFAIFMPSDVHRPGAQVSAPQKVRKVVIKVRMALLAQEAVQ